MCALVAASWDWSSGRVGGVASRSSWSDSEARATTTAQPKFDDTPGFVPGGIGQERFHDPALVVLSADDPPNSGPRRRPGIPQLDLSTTLSDPVNCSTN